MIDPEYLVILLNGFTQKRKAALSANMNGKVNLLILLFYFFIIGPYISIMKNSSLLVKGASGIYSSPNTPCLT